jgi:endoribonuclease LACTB2
LGTKVWVGQGALRPCLPAEETALAADGHVFETEAGPVRVASTPGHCPEHISLVWEGDPGVSVPVAFVGDLLMGEGDTTLIGAPEGDVDSYLKSLQRVDELDAAVLYPSHGPELRDPRDAIRRFRRHRLGRIQEVRSALQIDPSLTLDALIDIIYGHALVPALREAAYRSLQATLTYLEQESKAQ